MLGGLVLLIIVCGALQLAGVLVISGILGSIVMTIFMLIIAPLVAIMFVRGLWTWCAEQLNKKRK